MSMVWYEVVMWWVLIFLYLPLLIYACSFALTLGRCRAISLFLRSDKEQDKVDN